jgi:TonB family protein
VTVVDQLPFDVPPELRKPLGDSRLAWARYLNVVHNRVHPIFTDEFLVGLKQLPPSDPLNGELWTGLSITLEPVQGNIELIRVVRPSAVQALDERAVDAVRRAAPFGPAPNELLSDDGKVHFQWVLHRDAQLACSTYTMMPLLLRSAPAPIQN